MTPTAYLSYLRSAFSVEAISDTATMDDIDGHHVGGEPLATRRRSNALPVVAALVRFGVWGNAPCQPLMQPVPSAWGTVSPEPFAYQQRYDAGHDNRPPLPFSRA